MPTLVHAGLVAKGLQSPVTPAPTKQRRIKEEETPLAKPSSLAKQSSVRKELSSPRKQIIIHPTPIKGTPKTGFAFNFESATKTANVEYIGRPISRHEVYSKIFGLPPQIQRPLLDKESTPTVAESRNKSEPVPLKSPLKKRKVLDEDWKKKSTIENELSTTNALGKPLRNGSFAVHAMPVPPGPPQLPPTTHHNNNRQANSQTPGPPAQPPPVLRSVLPRLGGGFGSGLPVPATRRSTRVPKTSNPATTVKSAPNVVRSNGLKQSAPMLEKKILNGHDAPTASEKVVPPTVADIVSQTENVTMERPKGKLGGAQRVNRNREPTKAEIKKALFQQGNKSDE